MMKSHKYYWVVIVCMLGMLATSCRTRQLVVEHTLHDTLKIVQEHRDSIYVLDSVKVEVKTEGDTVFWTETKWKIRERLVEVHDTVRHVVRDTIPVPYEVTKGRTVTDWIGMVVASIILALFIVGFMFIIRKSP